MELTEDLISVQGVLISAHKTTGDFTRMNFFGGNENKIEHIIKLLTPSIAHYQTKDPENKPANDETLKNVTYFLLLNTDFKNKQCLELDDYFHLMNIIPQLSKCLLVNIVFELKLNGPLIAQFQTLPLLIIEELLSEIVRNLTHCDVEESLQHVFDYVQSAILRLNTIGEQEDIEVVSNISDALVQLTRSISGVNPEKTQGWPSSKFYTHLGKSLLCLLRLLNCCNLENNAIVRVMDNILRNTMEIMKAVTIDVFCEWAETDDNGESLQLIIAHTAYFTVDKYAATDSAKQLIEMLGAIAKKPKSLKKQIFEADLPTIISQINQADATNQMQWFHALLIDSDLLRNAAAIACLRKWSHLCAVDDVVRLLQHASAESEAIKQLVIGCATHLPLPDIVLVATRFFYAHGTHHCFTSAEHLTEELVLAMNQIDPIKSKEADFVKRICLLLLQRPKTLLSELYSGCLNSAIYAQCLQSAFGQIGDIVQAEDLAKECYVACYKGEIATVENRDKHKRLLNALLEAKHIDLDRICIDAFKPLLEEYLARKEFLNIDFLLQVINAHASYLTIHSQAMAPLLIELLKSCRNKFFDFLYSRQEIVRECMHLLRVYYAIGAQHNENYDGVFTRFQDEVKLNMYFIKRLCEETNDDILNYIFPICDRKSLNERVLQLIRLLPQATTEEWMEIYESLSKCHTEAQLLTILNTTMTLLCDAREESKDEGTLCLKYCLQNYGLLIKKLLKPNDKSMGLQQVFVKYLIKLLIAIPTDLKRNEGLRLAVLLPIECMKTMIRDHEFACSIVAIEDTAIIQAITQKIV